jgi:helicase
LLPLVRLEGIGRVRARILHNAGLKNLDDLRKTPIERLISLPLIGPKLAKKIKDQAGGFIKAEEWKKLRKGEEWEQKALTEY